MTPDELRALFASDEALAPDEHEVLTGVRAGIARRRRRGQAVIGAAVVLALILAGTDIAQPWQGNRGNADDRLAGVTTPPPSPSPSPTPRPSGAASPAPSPSPVPVPRAPSAAPSSPPRSPSASPSSSVDARPTLLASGLRIGSVEVPLGLPYSQALKRLQAAMGAPERTALYTGTTCPGRDIEVLVYDSGNLHLRFAAAHVDGEVVAGEHRLYGITTSTDGTSRPSTLISADGLALRVGSRLGDIRAAARQRGLDLEVSPAREPQPGPFGASVTLTTSKGPVWGNLGPDSSDDATVDAWTVGGSCGD